MKGIGKHRRRTALSWLFVAGLFVLCGVLGVLQYGWIGEVSVAARDRLRGSLQASLNRISFDFGVEIATAVRALLPADAAIDSATVETEVAARYAQWKTTARHRQMFRHIALAEPRNKSLVLRSLDLEKAAFETSAWPPDWAPVKARLETMMSAEARPGRGFPGPPPDTQGMLFDLPAFPLSGPGHPGGPPGRGEVPSLIFDFSPEYARDVLLPELLQRHLESNGTLEYQVEVLTRRHPAAVIYQSDPGAQVAASADASVGLFESPYDQIFRRGPGPGGRGRGSGRGGPGGDSGRWQMFARHRAGSLETVVAQLRWRNLAVTAGVLLLMMASVGALITYTRRAQKLADLQMDFVAGISHELRTPLTVIHTAAYNLRGKLAANPAQVERYGVLIQQESGRLKLLVEQVLRFSGATSGRVIQNPEPLSVPEHARRDVGIGQGGFSGGRMRARVSHRSASSARDGRPHGAEAGATEPAPQCRQVRRRRQSLGRRHERPKPAARQSPQWKFAWPIAGPESRPTSRGRSSNRFFAGAAPYRTRSMAPAWV